MPQTPPSLRPKHRCRRSERIAAARPPVPRPVWRRSPHPAAAQCPPQPPPQPPQPPPPPGPAAAVWARLQHAPPSPTVQAIVPQARSQGGLAFSFAIRVYAFRPGLKRKIRETCTRGGLVPPTAARNLRPLAMTCQFHTNNPSTICREICQRLYLSITSAGQPLALPTAVACPPPWRSATALLTQQNPASAVAVRLTRPPRVGLWRGRTRAPPRF